MTVILTTLPWLALLAVLPLALYRRPSLLSYPPRGARASAPAEASGPDGAAGALASPLVSVVVPTRDDAARIHACLSTLLATDHPSIEVLVVDQASVDGTREVVEAIAARDARVRLLDAGPVPDGWGVRAWSSRRGYMAASGDLLLFTDADTVHAASLLPRAVAALEAERADLLGVVPRLTVTGFWQRLLVPHIWLLAAARFPSARFVNRNRRPADAVAPREFLLVRRAALEAYVSAREGGAGGFERSLASWAVATGRRLFLAHGPSLLETRIHGTLGAVARDGTGAGRRLRLAHVPWTGALVPWLLAAAPLLLFVAPPAFLVGGWLVGGLAGIPGWAARATALSLLFWLGVYASYRIRPAYAMAYPVGAAVTAVIFARAVVRSRGDRGESPPAAPAPTP